MRVPIKTALGAALVIAVSSPVSGDIRDGLVAHWPFESTLEDVSGNGNNGTVIGNIPFVEGIIGQAAQFPGTGSDYISVAGEQFANLTGDLSVSVWVVSNGNASQWRAIVSNEEDGTSNPVLWPLRLMTYYGSGYPFFDFTINNRASSAIVTHATSIHDGQPHHIAVVREGSTVSIYVDGILSQEKTFTGAVDPSNAPLFIGRTPYNGVYPWMGIIDELRIYRRALTLAEVTELYGLSVGTPVAAIVTINPGTLNMKSMGNYITAYIEMPEGFLTSRIDPATLALSAIDGTDLGAALPAIGPSELGDYDENGVEDLMVKFDRQALIPLLAPGRPELVITGALADGTMLRGSKSIDVILKGK